MAEEKNTKHSKVKEKNPYQNYNLKNPSFKMVNLPKVNFTIKDSR